MLKEAPVATALAFAPLLLVASATPLDSLVAEAWGTNADVARAQADVMAAEAAVTSLSVVLPNPELEGGVRSDVVFANQRELDAEVALVQQLAWPGARLARKDGAERALAAARLRLALARLDVAARVQAAVGALAAANETMRVRGDIAQGARSLAEAARRRKEAGAAGTVEATLARADEALTDAALADAEAAVAAALSSLCALVARDEHCERLTAQAEWPALATLPAPASTTAAASGARADVRAAALDVEAAERSVAGAELDRLPTARLGIGYGFDQSVLDAPLLPDDVVDPDHVAGVTLSVTLPIWDWKSGDIARARADAARSEAELRRVQRAAATSVSAALARLKAASTGAERLAAVEADVAQALDDVQKAYVAGALPLDEALATRDRLLRTRLELVESKRKKVEAHAAALTTLADPRVVGIEVAE
jgi:cobalt-zinc-cadmium efflux system outer membrane protein